MQEDNFGEVHPDPVGQCGNFTSPCERVGKGTNEKTTCAKHPQTHTVAHTFSSALYTPKRKHTIPMFTGALDDLNDTIWWEHGDYIQLAG